MNSNFGLDSVWQAFVACAGGAVVWMAAVIAVVVGLSALAGILGGVSGCARRGRDPFRGGATRRAARAAEVC